MPYDAAQLVARARSDIESGRLLQISDSILDIALKLVDSQKPDPEILLEINRLKGIVARDQFRFIEANLYFDQARSIAAGMGNMTSACSLTLDKAVAAGMSQNAPLTQIYLTEAQRDFVGLRNADSTRKLHAEIVARQVGLLEMAGEVERAEHLAHSYLNTVRDIDDPEFAVSRLVTLARMQLGRTGKASSQIELWLLEAETHLEGSDSALRDLQWQSCVSDFLYKSGDVNGAAQHARNSADILVCGQFRHRLTESLLTRHELTVPRSFPTNQGDAPIVNNYINGNGNNIAINSSAITQNSTAGSPSGSLQEMRDSLAAAGVHVNQIAELEAAIEEDRRAGISGPGPAVNKWYQRVTGTAGSIAIGASGGLLAKAVASYFGLN